MSGETQQDVSGWTVDTLRQHFQTILTERDVRYEQRFKAQEHATNLSHEGLRQSGTMALMALEKAMDSKFEAQEKAVMSSMHASQTAIDKAEYAGGKKDEKDNEFRGQLKDQAATLMPRLESERLHHATSERIGDMSLRFDGRLNELVSRLDKAEGLNRLTSRIDTSEGRGAGMIQFWGWIVGAIGAASAILAIGSRFTH